MLAKIFQVHFQKLNLLTSPVLVVKTLTASAVWCWYFVSCLRSALILLINL